MIPIDANSIKKLHDALTFYHLLIEMTIVSIHQPCYLPWPIFFDKILNCDIFVLQDDVQYGKNRWHNRNVLRTKEDKIHLTIPTTAKLGTKINEVKIDNNQKWKQKHQRTIEINYSRHPYFDQYWKELEKIYERDYELLIDINLEIIQFFVNKLNIKRKLVLSSEFGINKCGSDKILELCKMLDADTYFSGRFGKEFLKPKDFQDDDIDVVFQKFRVFNYNQVYEPFIENLSTLDMLFNCGNKSIEILKNR